MGECMSYHRHYTHSCLLGRGVTQCKGVREVGNTGLVEGAGGGEQKVIRSWMLKPKRSGRAAPTGGGRRCVCRSVSGTRGQAHRTTAACTTGMGVHTGPGLQSPFCRPGDPCLAFGNEMRGKYSQFLLFAAGRVCHHCQHRICESGTIAP